MKNVFKPLINSFLKVFHFYGGVAGLIVFSIIANIKEKKGSILTRRILFMQIYFTGNQALKLTSMVAITLGAITVLQLFSQLSRFGALEYVGTILNIVLIRELGPVITAFIVIARSGTAIAAEISTMQVNEEVNALEIIGIDPLKFIVYPRIMGVVISLLVLNIYFNAIGILGGFAIGYLYSGITFDMFIKYVMNAITPIDIFSGFLKSFVFGFFISSISIYHGFQAKFSTQIPQVTTRAVVNSIIAVFFVDLLITILFYI